MRFTLAILDGTFVTVLSPTNAILTVLVIPDGPVCPQRTYGLLHEVRRDLQAPTYVRRQLAQQIVDALTVARKANV